MISYEEFLQRVERMDGLVRGLEASTEPAAQAARELAQTIVDLHGAGLARMLSIVGQAGDPGRPVLDKFVQDDLVRSLLLLHELHPLDLETRVRIGIEKVVPLARAYGADIEVVAIGDALVRLRLDGIDDSSPAQSTLQQALESAILEAAPDVTKIEFGNAPRSETWNPGLPIITLPVART